MLQCPNCTKEQLDAFDKQIASATPAKQQSEKKRRVSRVLQDVPVQGWSCGGEVLNEPNSGVDFLCCFVLRGHPTSGAQSSVGLNSKNKKIKNVLICSMQDAFKRLVADIIGKDVGQQFTKNAEIQDLPPLWRPRRRRQNANQGPGGDESLGICALFAEKSGSVVDARS